VAETLSPQIRLFALVGIIAATALGAFFFLFARPTASVEATPTTPPNKATTKARNPSTPRAQTHKPAQPKPRTTPGHTRSGYPAKIDRALRNNRVVVVAVYMPGSSVDRVVLAEARAGAVQGHAAYVPVSAANERVASQLVAKAGVVPQPAVLVLRRPGVVTSRLGVTDRATVAQAIALARG
jgi:hypothetical protein